MEKTIIIAEIGDNNGWYNIKTNEGIEVSVMQSKCPKLTAQLKDAKSGNEVTGNYIEKEGVDRNGNKEMKRYLWDLDEKKAGGFAGKSFAPRDKSHESAIYAAQASGNMLALTKDATTDQFDKFFEHIHTKIMSKVTKPTT